MIEENRRIKEVSSLGRLKAQDAMGKAAATDGPQNFFFFLILFSLWFLREKEGVWYMGYLMRRRGKKQDAGRAPFS